MRRFVAWLGRVATEPFDHRFRDLAAVAIAATCFTVGTVAFVFGTSQSGIHLGTDADGHLVIVSIDPWSPANASGLTPGMLVTYVDDQGPLLGDGGVAVPLDKVPLAGGSVPDGFFSVAAIRPDDLAAWEAGDPDGSVIPIWYMTDEWARQGSASAPIVGVLILAVGAWWLAAGNGGELLRRLNVPLVTATAAPLLLVPAALTWSLEATWTIAILLPLSALPLADGLTGLIESPDERRGARLLALSAAVATAVAGALMVTTGGQGGPPLVRWLLAGLITLVPAIVAAGPFRRGRLADGPSASSRVVERAELLAVGATPLVAGITLLVPSWVFVLPILLWIAFLLIAQRFTVRPLARVATRATLQRDLVVAATEAERARIATNLHDDALQDLTMLIRRLDTAGDVENADAARSIAERLRAITGELRLPLLDDLGAGPALEWLVARVERLAGGEVRLEREDGTRPPPDVELAFFRVAQEALANAVKHGRPPILVRYRASPSGATLTVDDAGPGIAGSATEAAETARLGGHFGLVGMQQRAEQIGAILDIRRWPTGGTHVALEWRPR